MGGTTRGSAKKAVLRSAAPSSQTAAPSSGSRSRQASTATVGDEVRPLGQCVKDLITTMNELERLGLGNLKIPLAKCVVCGDQSAGKSSVIEAISGIKVPRASGTCTRCPMFFKMENSTKPGSKFVAKVFLRRTYRFIPDDEDHWDEKFSQWELKPPCEEEPFCETNNLEELGKIIHGAQLAIVNPRSDPADYLPGSEGVVSHDDLQAEFSPNVVCVYLSAPELPSLSFYDLPGVITSRGDRKQTSLKKFIDNLILEYIKDPYALVLLVSAQESDWKSSCIAAELVSKAKATGRCVGVLTKPDRIDNDDRYADIEKALSGRLNPLGHGYFVVKCSSQSDINKSVTHAQAREVEEAFFDEKIPWAGEFSVYRDQFGTRNLQAVLSRKLAGLSLKALPTTRATINNQLQGIEDKLAAMPRPPTHGVTHKVRGFLTNLTNTVYQEMRSKEAMDHWRNTWVRLRKDLHKELQGLAPILRLAADLDPESFNENTPEMIDLCSDGEDGPSQPPSAPVTPRKRKYESSGTPSRNLVPESMGDGSPATKKVKTANKYAVKNNLDDVRAYLAQMSSAKLEDQVAPIAIERLMCKPMIYWKAVLSNFFTKLERELSMRLQQIHRDTLAECESTQLYRESQKIMLDFMNLHFEVQRMTKAADNELEGPWINYQPDFNAHLSKFLTKYTERRREHRENLFVKMMERVMKPAELAAELKKESFRIALNNDPYAQEVKVLAQVRAYYELASKRFLDTICVPIEAELFKELSGNLLEHLNDKLQLKDENEYRRCIELLADDSRKEQLRRELEAHKAALLAGQKCLNDLDDKYKNDASFYDDEGVYGDQDGDHDMLDDEV